MFFSFSDMAQNVFQMPGVWHDAKYEKLQRLRQTTVLQCVSVKVTLVKHHVYDKPQLLLLKHVYVCDTLLLQNHSV